MEMSKRLQEFAQLLQKHMDCLIAYIAPNYFESMRMSAQLQDIESEIDELAPIVERIDNNTLTEKTEELNQDIATIKSNITKLGLSEIGNDLFLINLPPQSENIDKQLIWSYYEFYKKLNSIEDKLNNLKTYTENANIEDQQLKQNLLNNINNAISKTNELKGLIPEELKQWFDKREQVLQSTTKEINLLDIATNPDKLKGITACLNLTRDIYCKNQFRQAVCYASFLGLQIQEMLGSVPAHSRDNFIQDFARRLGGKQVIEVDDMFASFKGMVKEICGESINDLDSMYQQMKNKVKEIQQLHLQLQHYSKKLVEKLVLV